MSIEPLPNVLYLKLAEQKVGNWDTSSKDSAVEFAEVIAIAECGCIQFCGNIKDKCTCLCHLDEKGLKVGDKVFVKAWAIDNVFHNGEWYRFVNMETNGILAIIHEEKPTA